MRSRTLNPVRAIKSESHFLDMVIRSRERVRRCQWVNANLILSSNVMCVLSPKTDKNLHKVFTRLGRGPRAIHLNTARTELLPYESFPDSSGYELDSRFWGSTVPCDRSCELCLIGQFRFPVYSRNIRIDIRSRAFLTVVYPTAKNRPSRSANSCREVHAWTDI